jgi:hypothetical protein
MGRLAKNRTAIVELKIGSRDDHPKFWEVAGDYAVEIVEKTEKEIQRGVDGIPVPFAPC